GPTKPGKPTSSAGQTATRNRRAYTHCRSDAMPASKTEQVLDALKARLETVPDTVVERNSVLPEEVPARGLMILRDGDPGEPEQALGGFGSTYYQHAVEIEVYVEQGDAAVRDSAFDDLLWQ